MGYWSQRLLLPIKYIVAISGYHQHYNDEEKDANKAVAILQRKVSAHDVAGNVTGAH